MTSLHIIYPGILTTVQDYGRYGWLKYGVPVSGPMDEYSLQLANILVNNNLFEAALEMTVVGATIEFDGATAIALTGADINPMLNGNPVNMYMTHYVNKGDVLSFGTLKSGLRTYMSVSGGFNLNNIMGSKSTYLRGNFGGFKGRKLQTDDVLDINSNLQFRKFGIRRIPDNMIPNYQNEVTARVIIGTEDEYFTKEGLNTFFNSRYTVSNQSDRMGIRLHGAPIEHTRSADVISGPVVRGAIQVPADDQPIILMSDCQTTGGYTKIATVISVDLPYIGQLIPGSIISFKNIGIEEAHQLYIEQKERIRSLIAGFSNSNDKNVIGGVRKILMNLGVITPVNRKNSQYK